MGRVSAVASVLDRRLSWSMVMACIALGCADSKGGSSGPGDGDGGTTGTGGTTGIGGTGSSGDPSSGGNLSIECEPDDGIADPPCAEAEVRCNGKCFSAIGQCRAGCQLVAMRGTARGAEFGDGFMYIFDTPAMQRVNLDTLEATPVPNAFQIDSAVAANGTVYWLNDDGISRLEPDGSSTLLYEGPYPSADRMAIVGDLLLAGTSLGYAAMPLAGGEVIELPFEPSSLGYDDTYIYFVDRLAGDAGLYTYRVRPDQLDSPELLVEQFAKLSFRGGYALSRRVFGDYLYWYDYGDTETTLNRLPIGGGESEPVAIVPDSYENAAAFRDHFCGVSATGEVICHTGPDQSHVAVREVDAAHDEVYSDGQDLFYAADAGGFFRIVR